MHWAKLVAKIALNALAIAVFALLQQNKISRAGYCATVGIAIVGVSSTLARLTQAEIIGWQEWYYPSALWWQGNGLKRSKIRNVWVRCAIGFSFVAPWVVFAYSVAEIGFEGLHGSLDTQKYFIYGALAGAVVTDTFYMWLRREDTKGNMMRVATYAFAVVMYASVAASVYYLNILVSHGVPLGQTLAYPSERVRNTTCRTKTQSTDGTPLIWAITETRDKRCAYQTWEHLRSNLLFLITFSIGCSLLFDFERTNKKKRTNLLARVLGLFSYALQFAGYTNIIDSLDSLWHVSTGSLGLLSAHFALNMIVAALRAWSTNKHKQEPGNASDSEDEETQQPPTDETPLMTPLEPVRRLDLSGVLRQRRHGVPLLNV